MTRVLLLLWLGSASTRFEKQVKSAVKQCFSAVQPRVVYYTNDFLSTTNKDLLPALLKSNVIYQFLYHCDSRYVGRTSQRLLDRINNMSQIYPFLLFFPKNAYFLLVGANLPLGLISRLLLLIRAFGHWTSSFKNPTCAQHYDDRQIFYSCPRPLTIS